MNFKFHRWPLLKSKQGHVSDYNTSITNNEYAETRIFDFLTLLTICFKRVKHRNIKFHVAATTI